MHTTSLDNRTAELNHWRCTSVTPEIMTTGKKWSTHNVSGPCNSTTNTGGSEKAQHTSHVSHETLFSKVVTLLFRQLLAQLL